MWTCFRTHCFGVQPSVPLFTGVYSHHISSSLAQDRAQSAHRLHAQDRAQLATPKCFMAGDEGTPESLNSTPKKYWEDSYNASNRPRPPQAIHPPPFAPASHRWCTNAVVWERIFVQYRCVGGWQRCLGWSGRRVEGVRTIPGHSCYRSTELSMTNTTLLMR